MFCSITFYVLPPVSKHFLWALSQVDTFHCRALCHQSKLADKVGDHQNPPPPGFIANYQKTRFELLSFMLPAHNERRARRGFKMSPCLIRSYRRRQHQKKEEEEGEKAEEGIAWWKTQMTYQISLMNWSIYWNKLNWCKGSQRSRKLFSYGWKPSQSCGTYQQPSLFVLRRRLVKMCWQPLFIPLNKSVLLCCVFVLFFFISELKCLLINLGQKEEQMQLFKWRNLITFVMAKKCLCSPVTSLSPQPPHVENTRYPYGEAACELCR